jgi:hypothetical protein
MSGARSMIAPGATALATLALLGCSQQHPAAPDSPALAQAELCVTTEVRVESGCNPGQRVVFMPERFGNEQLPVMFASMNCDLRYAVAMTNGGVTCVFMKARRPQRADEGSVEAGPASSAPAGK